MQVRTNTWRELSMGGHPAVAVTADFVEGKVKKTACQVWAFDGSNAVSLFLAAAAEDFEAFRPRFDALVESYKSN